MNQALRAVSAAGAGWADVLGDLAFLFVFAGLMLVLGGQAHRHMLDSARRI